MKFLIVRWLVTAGAVALVPAFVPGVAVAHWSTALVAGAVLSLLNLSVKPLLILLTLPLTIVSMGFFLLVLNALMFRLAGALVPGLVVHSFGAAFLSALFVSAVVWLLQPTARSHFRVFRPRTPRRPQAPAEVYELSEKAPGVWE